MSRILTNNGVDMDDVMAQEAQKKYTWYLRHFECLPDIHCDCTRVIQTAEDKYNVHTLDKVTSKTPIQRRDKLWRIESEQSSNSFVSAPASSCS